MVTFSDYWLQIFTVKFQFQPPKLIFFCLFVLELHLTITY